MENNENENNFQAAQPKSPRDTKQGGSKNSAEGQNKSQTRGGDEKDGGDRDRHQGG